MPNFHITVIVGTTVSENTTVEVVEKPAEAAAVAVIAEVAMQQ